MGRNPSGDAVTDEPHRTTGLVARGIEAQVPQQHQDVHGRGPSTVPRRAAPPPVGPLESEQPGTPALGGDPRALGRDLSRGCPDQVLHHLPADRRVGIKQPRQDRGLQLRGWPLGWMGGHLVVLFTAAKKRCWLQRGKVTL